MSEDPGNKSVKLIIIAVLAMFLMIMLGLCVAGNFDEAEASKPSFSEMCLSHSPGVTSYLIKTKGDHCWSWKRTPDGKVTDRECLRPKKANFFKL